MLAIMELGLANPNHNLAIMDEGHNNPHKGNVDYK